MTTTGDEKDKKKGRFGRFLSGRKDKDREEQAEVPRPQVSATNTTNTTNTDSAYASSENGPARKSSPDFVPVEHHDISGVDQNRSLWLDKNNGDIYDEDTGDVVTTVTTTTTTTTTTTSRGGRRQEAVDVKTTRTEATPGSIDNRPGSTIGTLPVKETGGLNEMPAGNTIPTTSQTTTSVVPPTEANTVPPTLTDTMRNDHTTFLPPDTSRAVPVRTDSSPPIPSKHPNRVSGEFNRNEISEYEQAHPSIGEAAPISPVTPSQHNFSYPSRSGPAGSGLNEPGVKKSGSTFANLKAAAVAAHGIGETLRGTLNESIDSRYPRKDTTKNEAARLKNQAALERGRTEMERLNMGRYGSRNDANLSAADTNLSYADSNVSHTNVPGTGSPIRDNTTNIPHTDTPVMDSANNNSNYHPPTGTAVGQSNTLIQSSYNETGAPATETKSSGFGKLFKRKPVSTDPQAEGQQGSRYY